MKFERGWEGFDGQKLDQNTDLKGWGLDHLDFPIDPTQSEEAIRNNHIGEQFDQEVQKSESRGVLDSGSIKETNDERVKARLDDIETLYVGISLIL